MQHCIGRTSVHLHAIKITTLLVFDVLVFLFVILRCVGLLEGIVA